MVKVYEWKFASFRNPLRVAAWDERYLSGKFPCRLVAAATGAANIPPPKQPITIRFVTRQCRALSAHEPKLAKSRCTGSWYYVTNSDGEVTRYGIVVLLQADPKRHRGWERRCLSFTLGSIAHELRHIYDYHHGTPKGRPTSHGNRWEFRATCSELQAMQLFVRSKPWRRYFDRLARQMHHATQPRISTRKRCPRRRTK